MTAAARAAACLAILASLAALASADAAVTGYGQLPRAESRGAHRRLQQDLNEVLLEVFIQPGSGCASDLNSAVCFVYDPLVSTWSCTSTKTFSDSSTCCMYSTGPTIYSVPTLNAFYLSFYPDVTAVPDLYSGTAPDPSGGESTWFLIGSNDVTPGLTISAVCTGDSGLSPSPPPAFESPSPLEPEPIIPSSPPVSPPPPSPSTMPSPSPSRSPMPSPSASSPFPSPSSPSSSPPTDSSSSGGSLAVGIIILIACCAAAALIVAGIVVVVVRRRRAKKRRLAETGRLFDPDLGDGNTAPKPPPVVLDDPKLDGSTTSATVKVEIAEAIA